MLYKTSSFENPVVKYHPCPDIKKKLALESCQKHMLGFVLLQTRPCMPSRPAGGQGHRALPWASFTLGVPVGTGTQEPFDVTLRVGPTSFSATEPHTVLWRCLTSHSLRPQRAGRLTAKSMPLGASRGPCLRADLVAQAPHPREKEPPRSPAQPSVPVVLNEPAKGWSQLSEKGHRI